MWLADLLDKHPEQAMQLGDPENIQLITGDEVFDSIEAKVATGKHVSQDELLNTFFEKDSVEEIKMMFKENKTADEKFMDFIGQTSRDHDDVLSSEAEENTQFEFGR